MTPQEINNSWILDITLTPPSLKDNTADVERLLSALKMKLASKEERGEVEFDIDLSLMRRLPELLRKWDYAARCLLFRNKKKWVLVEVKDPLNPDPLIGAAIDLGTTRVVLRLVDLATGNTLSEVSFDNPQISIGPDILTRIHFAESDEGLRQLNALIISRLNENLSALCHSRQITPRDIYILAVAGNTAMTHLFMALPPHWIIREPYIPVVNSPGTFLAKDLGIAAHPSARVLMFPNIGSYFGGDLIAGIVYSELNKREETAILVDVGTNAEVVLGNRNWLIACAGAAGPALEGGVTKMGMMAGPGVIDRVSANQGDSHFTIHTIEEKPPRGICGSGLIDLAAMLFLSGRIDIRGKFIPAACGEALKEKEGIRHFVVVSSENSATGEDLTISQVDLDSLIRSKAAMYTILETITATVGMTLSDLSAFYVAGTFGSFINPVSAITIGMLPDLPLSHYIPIGNSSLGGATLAITSRRCFDEIEEIRNQITYMELNVNQEFMNLFSAAKFLPHTNRSSFPSVTVWER